MSRDHDDPRVLLPWAALDVQGRSLVTIPIAKYVGAEYVAVWYDATRMVAIQCMVHLMAAFMGGAQPLSELLVLLVYVVLAVLLYWLVLCKLVRFN